MNLVVGDEVLCLSDPNCPLISGDILVYLLVNGSSFKKSWNFNVGRPPLEVVVGDIGETPPSVVNPGGIGGTPPAAVKSGGIGGVDGYLICSPSSPKYSL